LIKKRLPFVVLHVPSIRALVAAIARSLARAAELITHREQQRSSAGPETPVIAKSEAKKAQRSAAPSPPMAEDLVRKLEAEVQHESTASTYAVLVVKRARGRESGTARESASARIRKSQRQRERTHRRSFVNTTRLLTIYRIVPRDCCETARQSERERASKRERARESGRERVNDTHPCRLCCRRHRHRHRSSKRRDA